MAIAERNHASGGEPSVAVGEIIVDETPTSLNVVELETKANAFLGKPEKQGVFLHARNTGKDIVAAVTSHGTVLYIGAGIAVSLIAAGIGAVAIYEHNKKK